MRIRTPAASATVLLLVGLAFPGCGGDLLGPGDELPDVFRAAGISTDGWRVVERPGFSIRVPPGFEDLGLQPIDSDAAVFRKGEDSTLSYDHGVYSGPIQIPPEATEVRRNVRTRIGGREATLLAYRHAGDWRVAARWDDLGSSSVGELALLVVGVTPSVDVRDRIVAAIHTVRFP